MSMDRLLENIMRKQNPTVAGLDPKLSFIPEHIKEKCFEEHGKNLEGAAAALLEFNKGLIDALFDVVPAVKPQAAYYEQYGWQGMKALAETITYAKAKGLFVITDGKRNDIGATMEAYAVAHLGKTDVEGETFEAFGADALTVNGYLGSDGIEPLLKVCAAEDKGSRASTAIAVSARWWEPPTRSSLRRCARLCQTHSSWCPAMGLRAARLMMWPPVLTSMAAEL